MELIILDAELGILSAPAYFSIGAKLFTTKLSVNKHTMSVECGISINKTSSYILYKGRSNECYNIYNIPFIVSIKKINPGMMNLSN